MRFATTVLATACVMLAATISSAADDVMPPVTERFADKNVDETPDFQRHVVPLFGRLGCNGRSCHGSFQGRGGFRLSLFGYDFKADHEALFDKDSPRVDVKNVQDSLIIHKPTDEFEHEGGERYKKGSWEHRLLTNWIKGGAEFKSDVQKLVELEVTPNALHFAKADEQAQLRVTAVWEDGVREDVTPLCRFQSNNTENAQIDENGLVVSKKPGDTHVVVFYDKAVVPVPVVRPVSEQYGDRYPKIAASTKVDALVIDKLRRLGVVPSDLCTDSEFLRRVRLDLTGTLPTASEVKQFLADESPNKRSAKIDQLLETEEYSAWWATKLCDFTGNNEQQLNNLTPGGNRGQAGSDWYNWIRTRVAKNEPYDKLAAGIVTAVSRPEGMEYREYCEMMSELYREDDKSFADLDGMSYYWARRDLRQPPERAIAFAYSFMGVRIQCAQCHKHPFDQWSKQDFEDFSKFFSTAVYAQNGRDRKEYNQMIKELGLQGERGGQLRRKLGPLLEEGKTVPFGELYVRPTKGKARLLGGDEIDLAEVDDPRDVVMQWLRKPNNRFFSTAFVNRVWASYFKTGIVEPPDDLSLANPPSNKPLLDHLAKGFVESGFDMKWVHREILNSDTYQRSWRPNETNAGDERNFSRMAPRRLPAEVVYDAVRQATLADPRVDELFTNLSDRAICLPASGQRGRNGSNYALTIFGRSTRESNCDCDRSSSPSLLQTVYLQNDFETLNMIAGSRDEGWVEQVEIQYGLRAARNQLKTAEQQAERLKAQLQKLKKDGANRTQQQRLKQSYANIQRRIKQLQKLDRGGKVDYERKEYDPQEIVREAYLRTLSRMPTEDELNRSVAYIEEAETKSQGVRDVLWALVNTKEFIVNH